MVSISHAQLAAWVDENRDLLVDTCSTLIQCPSETPPSDTRAIANAVSEILRSTDGVEVTKHTLEDPVANVVARVSGCRQGPRLVFNGHLDTFPAGDHSAWTHGPFSAVSEEGRIYGRGATDMKGGIACSMLAMILLARCRDQWSGEAVLTVAGDEEAMGPRGAQFLLETVPGTEGDAMISGDAGAPQIVRFGEKGFVWVKFEAKGVASHGAHVHNGKNAADLLINCLAEVRQSMEDIPVRTPEVVADSISHASERSEAASGQGETQVLQSITMNLGEIHSGYSPNLVPAKANAACDFRLPIGVSVSMVEEAIENAVNKFDGVSYSVTGRFEPSWSDPSSKIFRLITHHVHQVSKVEPALNIRVGASDSRLYRARKVPTVVCGLTPHNLGAPDEYVEIDEMIDVAKIHLLTAFDFLSGEPS